MSKERKAEEEKERQVIQSEAKAELDKIDKAIQDIHASIKALQEQQMEAAEFVILEATKVIVNNLELKLHEALKVYERCGRREG